MVDSRNLSVMFTDIKGFTARTAKSTREDLAALLKTHEAIVLPRAQARGGVLIKTIGDAFLLTFETPTNALLAAIDAQVALRSHNAGIAEENRIEVRMGINAGEVTVIEGDVYGDAVNIASRIESAAEASEIFFSETVYLTMNKTEVNQALEENGLESAEVGFRSLKGVDGDVRIYKIFSSMKPGGLRTLELEPSDGGSLALDDGSAGAAQTSASGAVQPFAEIELKSSGPLEIERTPEIATAAPRRPTRPQPRPTGEQAPPKASRASGGLLRRLLLVPAVGVSLAGVAVLAAGVVLQSVWIATAGALLLVTASPLRLGLRHAKTSIARVLALVLLALMLAVFNATPVKEIQLRLDGLTTELRQSGRAEFGVRDRAAVWMMELLHFVHLSRLGYREAARQQLYRLWPGHESRRFSSDIAMRAPSVLSPLVELNRQLRIAWHRGVKEVPIGPHELRLRSGQDPPRVMAVMPTLRLGGRAVRRDEGWDIQAVALVPVGCGPPGPAPVIELGGETVKMEQLLCTYVEEAGWLSAYTAKWSWTLSSEDPRLAIGAGGRTP